MAKAKKWFFPAGMIEEGAEGEYKWWSCGESEEDGGYVLLSGIFYIEHNIGYLVDGEQKPIDRKSVV